MHAAARRSAWAALVVAFLYLAGLQDARAGKVGHVRHFNKLTLTVTPEYCIVTGGGGVTAVTVQSTESG